MSHLFVTGGAGYIGSHLLKSLVGSGESVTVLDNLSTGRRQAIPDGVKLIDGQLEDSALLAQIFATQKFDAVIHLAALVNAAESVTHPQEYLHVNAELSAALFRLAVAQRVPHLLFASSAAVYGTPQTTAPITENHPLVPTNPYGVSKLQAEVSLRTTTAGSDTTYAALRFFNVAGADSSRTLSQNPASRAIMVRLFAAAQKGEGITISGHDYPTPDGTVIRDFIHVQDIVTGIIQALAYLRAGGQSLTVNLARGEGTTLRQLHQVVQEVSGRIIPLTFAPPVPGDISISLGDSSLATRTLGWRPKHSLTAMVRSGWEAYVQLH